MLVESFGAQFTLCGHSDTINTLWYGGGAESSVALRILFSYFVNGNINMSFNKFRDNIIRQENAKQLTLSLVLRAIYESKQPTIIEHTNTNKGNKHKLAIIVGIDEVNKV